MKIGVVAYEMEGARTGVGRYLEGLLDGLAKLGSESRPPDWRWQLFFKGEPFDHPLWDSPSPDGPCIEPIFDGRPRARPILWEQLRLPSLLRRQDVDFVFSPCYSLPPMGALPSLVTVHDLSFEHLPAEFSWKERWRRRLLTRRAVKQARRVLTDTHAIAKDLSKTYGTDPGKIGVVPLALDASLFSHVSSGSDSRILAEYGVERPYALHLGSILERRRIDLVFEAFAALAPQAPDLRLVIAGHNRLRRPRDLERLLSGSGVADRVLRVGYLGDEAVMPFYRQASLVFYVSTYEGYGLPPLESLAAGTPAVVGPGLALDDLWPDYPYRCQAFDGDSVTAAARAALANVASLDEFGEEARRRLRALSWRHSAELLIGEIERALQA